MTQGASISFRTGALHPTSGGRRLARAVHPAECACAGGDRAHVGPVSDPESAGDADIAGRRAVGGRRAPAGRHSARGVLLAACRRRVDRSGRGVDDRRLHCRRLAFGGGYSPADEGGKQCRRRALGVWLREGRRRGCNTRPAGSAVPADGPQSHRRTRRRADGARQAHRIADSASGQRLRRLWQHRPPPAEAGISTVARSNARRAYDLSNELFEMCLEGTMSYSRSAWRRR